ncbi:hypothetical protein [Ollibium composti]|jgi:hypothetical protein|uniref:Uncharacterized protein n=1 Tax=Ollibium composti TaxID=2675109 RepID=A0ABY2QF91_9HYPH|nr:hypothetical protein [Mesorhizobium composti]THF59927.1 hypothetical protein E6C48_02435 [Mesorhizobium composti]
MEETGVEAAFREGAGWAASPFCSDIERRSLPLRITIPPKPFFVLLRMVTPIDHFPLILFGHGGLTAQTWRESNRCRL